MYKYNYIINMQSTLLCINNEVLYVKDINLNTFGVDYIEY